VPLPGKLPGGCVFNPRCPHADDRCRSEAPLYTRSDSGHGVRCWLHRKEAL